MCHFWCAYKERVQTPVRRRNCIFMRKEEFELQQLWIHHVPSVESPGKSSEMKWFISLFCQELMRSFFKREAHFWHTSWALFQNIEQNFVESNAEFYF